MRTGILVLVCFWSLKGGVGCSVTAAIAALAASAPPTGDVLLVDPLGDLAAVLGRADPDGPGIAEWAAAGDDAPPGALRRAATAVRERLALVGPGRLDLPASGPTDGQLATLAAAADAVVVDAGNLLADGPASAFGSRIAAAASRSVLVTRACYLALRRVSRSPVAPSAVVLLDEVGRALSVADVESAVGAPVVARIAVDRSVARAVDAGLLAGRVPRGAVRALAAVA